MLLLAVVMIALTTGLLSVLALNTTRMHRQRQADRVRAAVVAMSDSAAGYVRAKPAHLPATTQPVELDVSELLPPQMTGSVMLTFPADSDSPVCRITARAELGNQWFEEVTDLALAENNEPRP
jgi:hypothetical protein